MGKWREDQSNSTWEFKNDGSILCGSGFDKVHTKGTYTLSKDELTTRWDGGSTIVYRIRWLGTDSVELLNNSSVDRLLRRAVSDPPPKFGMDATRKKELDSRAVIEKRLDHHDAVVRDQAAMAMLRLHPERLQIARLLEFMALPNDEVRSAARRLLSMKLAGLTAKDMQLLRLGLNNPVRETQLAFIETVGSLKEEGKAAAPDLTALVGSADKVISAQAIIALEKMGKLVDIVQENAEAAILTPTLVALRTKGIKTAEAVVSYEKHLDHPDIGVRDAAGLILLDLDSDRLKSDRLVEFVSGANGEIRTVGLRILRKRLTTVTVKDMPMLRRGLNSPTLDVRIFFVNAIASLKADGKDAVADLADLLGPAEKEIAIPIIHAMEAMGKAGGKAIPSLEKKMEDSEKPVAVAAAHALCKIDPTSNGVITRGVELLLEDLNPDLSKLGALLADPLGNRSASSLLEIGEPAVTPVVKYLLQRNHPMNVKSPPIRKIEAAAGRLIGYELVKEFAKKAKLTNDKKLTIALKKHEITLDAFRSLVEPPLAKQAKSQPALSPEVRQLYHAAANAAFDAHSAVKALRSP